MVWNRKKSKTSKYGNKKVEYDGYEFDSKKECNRYQELQILVKKGEIKGLTVQPKWTLMPTTWICGDTQRKTTYSADFSYIKKGKQIVEDVKGGDATKTDVYKLKRKMMMVIHGIEVVEV